MPRRLAFELTHAEARALVVTTSESRITVEKSLTIPLGTGEQEAERPTVEQTVVDAFSNNGITRLETIAVVGRGDIELRLLSVPPAPDEELPNLVQRDALGASGGILVRVAPFEHPGRGPPVLLLLRRVLDVLKIVDLGRLRGLAERLGELFIPPGFVRDRCRRASDVACGHAPAAPDRNNRHNLSLLGIIQDVPSFSFSQSSSSPLGWGFRGVGIWGFRAPIPTPKSLNPEIPKSLFLLTPHIQTRRPPARPNRGSCG